nr:PREDICTED: UDP-glucuronosyltransferase 1-1-like [Lepisosteus oculatus]
MAREHCIGVAGFFVFLSLSALGPVEGGKLLVMPVDGSHWLSMQLLVKELAHRGHEVVVLVPEASIFIKGSDDYRSEHFPVPHSKEQLQVNGVFVHESNLAGILLGIEKLLNFTNMQVKGCESLLYNQPLMQRLREGGYDLMLTDPFLPCGAIIAETLSLPTVFFLSGIPCGLEMAAAQCPSPPSFVPQLFTENTDRMTFPQRVKNFMMLLVQSFLCKNLYASFDEVASRFLKTDVTYKELIGRGSIWLLKYDFTLEFPRPLMPNMALIGGINCAKQSALPAVSLVSHTAISLIPQCQQISSEFIINVYGFLSFQVLWRYTGPIPDNLPDNIKIMKWLPQNDLLGHPKARAFITHGGTHGIYEGICNGVPMVMLPLFGDQSDNAHRMEARGVGVVLSINQITTEVLLEAVNKVINNKSYKEKMTKLSALHRDRPVEPMDLAVFWTEFVMRHKGAQHLRPAAHELNWIQYHSLDVIGLLITIVVVLVIVTVRSCAFCFRKCCCKKPSLKNKSD